MLYFFLKPPPDTALNIYRLGASLVSDIRREASRMPPERLHFTLAGLGERTPEMLFLARHAAAQVRVRPFAVELDRMARWDPNMVLTADDGVLGVHGLHDALVRELALLGVAPASSQFAPHLTVIYGGGEIEEQPIEPIRWTATEFVLVDSHDSRHDLLGEWPLMA